VFITYPPSCYCFIRSVNEVAKLGEYCFGFYLWPCFISLHLLACLILSPLVSYTATRSLGDSNSAKGTKESQQPNPNNPNAQWTHSLAKTLQANFVHGLLLGLYRVIKSSRW
jgi:hypothetical protein